VAQTAVDDELAAVYEHIPAERLALSYLRARSLRSGQSYARMILADAGGAAARARFALDAFVKMTAAYAIAAAAFPLDRAASLRFAMKAWSNRGKLRDVAGRPLKKMYQHAGAAGRHA
jgi:succinoglycan biosynthesis protein ExoM